MRKQSRDTVNHSLPFVPLAHLAIAWANDPDAAGRNVKEWVEGFEEFQTQHMWWDGGAFLCDPPSFPRNGRDRVVTWLRKLAKGSMSTALKNELSDEVGKIDGACGVVWVEELGELVTSTSFKGTPLALAAAGVMALASHSLRDGFGQCEWCDRFFLETAVRPGQRGRKYCPDRACGVSARQDRFKGGTGRKGGL